MIEVKQHARIAVCVAVVFENTTDRARGGEAMKKETLKKYKVTLEYRIRESFEIEAVNEIEAEKEAKEQIEVTPFAEHWDTKIVEL